MVVGRKPARYVAQPASMPADRATAALRAQETVGEIDG